MHYFVLPEFVPAFALVKSKNVYLPLKPFLQQNWQSVNIYVFVNLVGTLPKYKV